MVKIPDKTTINDQEYTQHGALGIAPELIDVILSGQKLTTYRYGKKYDYLQVGDEVKINDSDTGKTACIAKVVDKKTMTFGDLPFTGDANMTYRDKEHQRQVFSGYYAFLGRPIEDNDEFLRIEFQLANQV